MSEQSKSVASTPRASATVKPVNDDRNSEGSGSRQGSSSGNISKPQAWAESSGSSLPLKRRKGSNADAEAPVVASPAADDLRTNLVRIFQHSDFENKGYLTLQQLRDSCYLAGVAEDDGYRLFIRVAESVAVENDRPIPALPPGKEETMRRRTVDDCNEIVMLGDLLAAIQESRSRGVIQDTLVQMNKVLHAEIGYTFEWSLLAFPSYFLIPSVVMHAIMTSVPLEWWHMVINICLFAPPYIYVCTPFGYAQFQRCFESLNNGFAVANFAAGLLYVAVMIAYYLLDGTGYILVDWFSLSAFNTSAMLWAATLIAASLPSASKLDDEGVLAEAREVRRLDIVPAVSEYMPEIKTVGDVLRAAEAKAEQDNTDRRGWGELISFWVMFVIVAAFMFLLPFIYRVTVSIDQRIFPLDWALFVAQGIGNVFALYTLIKVYIYRTKDSYLGMTKLLRLAGTTMNSEEAARESMPFIPLFKGNNDYAYIVLRTFITKFYELRSQAQASFKFTLIAGATVICGVYVLIAVTVRNTAILLSAGIPMLVAMLLLSTILIAALVVNETLSSNNHRVAEEVLYTQTRLEDSSVVDIEHVSALTSMNDYFQNHTVPLEILSIPITPRTLMALRAGVGGFVVLIYSTFINPNANN